MKHRRAESGYILLTILIGVTLMAIALAAAVPAIKTSIRRQNEIELQHRGNEYVSAIRKYYHKFGRYPSSIDELVNSNNTRFLRKRYKDPMTGKDDWRVIHLGEAKYPPKIKMPGGQQPGAQTISQNIGTSLGQPVGNNGNNGFSLGSTDQSANAQSGTQTQGGTGNGTVGGVGANAGLNTGNSSGFGGAGMPIIGVAIPSTDKSLKVYNERQQYNEWEFIYDPRIEAMNMAQSGAGGALTNANGGVGNLNPGGTNPQDNSPLPTSPTANPVTPPQQPPATTPQ